MGLLHIHKNRNRFHPFPPGTWHWISAPYRVPNPISPPHGVTPSWYSTFRRVTPPTWENHRRSSSCPPSHCSSENSVKGPLWLPCPPSLLQQRRYGSSLWPTQRQVGKRKVRFNVVWPIRHPPLPQKRGIHPHWLWWTTLGEPLQWDLPQEILHLNITNESLHFIFSRFSAKIKGSTISC